MAETPWSTDSRAVAELIEASDYTTVKKDGMDYFMLVGMAWISREEFSQNGLQSGDVPSLCEALIDRALLRPTRFDRPRAVFPNQTFQSEEADDVAVSFNQSSTFQDFLDLTARQQARVFKTLSPYDDPPLFESVRSAFLEAYPECGAPNEVFVGDIGGLGPINGIAVKVAPGRTLRVPRRFMGILVCKRYKSKSGWRTRY